MVPYMVNPISLLESKYLDQGMKLSEIRGQIYRPAQFVDEDVLSL